MSVLLLFNDFFYDFLTTHKYIQTGRDINSTLPQTNKWRHVHTHIHKRNLVQTQLQSSIYLIPSLYCSLCLALFLMNFKFHFVCQAAQYENLINICNALLFAAINRCHGNKAPKQKCRPSLGSPSSPLWPSYALLYLPRLFSVLDS